MVTDSEQRISDICAGWRKDGLTVGFVPTMGAFHKGHLSLVEIAAASSARVVVSIFVNPTQFGPDEDLDRYPVALEEDCRLLEELDVSAVFTPRVDVVYPEDFSTGVYVTGISEGLCGSVRPGHFNGVTTVCAVLFGIIKPDLAVFGMKDAQQLAVIRQMVSDLRMGIDIVAAPIVREPDGLAMSSRNQYLSADERKQACLISTGLEAALSLFQTGERNCELLRNAFLDTLKDAPKLRAQYVETVDPDTMLGVEIIENPVLLVVAVFAGKTRLIDNILIEPEV
ncbi:MAG: pantoate--beta-alanine ligase [Candidatus Sabulitectum sp.]|nr:pantoate--beta-alanine ligase [Candidatus Sabulitectum sp.]